MTDIVVIDIGRNALLTLMYLGGPMLITALVVGLAVSIFQAATQINEMTMTFIPKILAVAAVLLFMMPTMLKLFRAFFNSLIDMIPNLIP
ncbi:MAG: flagellar biosynthesis protein FliQ [Fibrobacterales bacterium]